jgi:UDP-N-acetylglucosamine diphosphorylase/glucosamine-1-phosphate N-acetyltransferase
MADTVCIFEDNRYGRLLPLVFFRPVYNLRCGMSSLKEKIIRRFPKAAVTLHCRGYLAEYMRLSNPGVRVNEVPSHECLLVNGRVIAHQDFARRLQTKHDVVFMHKDDFVAVRVSGTRLTKLREKLNEPLSISAFDGLPRQEVDAELISYPWDLVRWNGPELRRDFAELVGKKRHTAKRGNVYPGVYLLNKKEIVIAEGATVKPGTVLDAEEGPIYIGRNVRVFPHAMIIGPAYIGDGSWVKGGAHIYENTTIGPMCKVGGEVEDTIIHGYSNKQHAGFLGHSYIGAWVNLGADTNNSDLKNNYGRVRVQIGSEQIDTGLQFVGMTMGDHSKSAINSMFNTGTVVGVSSNIFGHGFPPKYVPSFSWGAAGETFTTFSIDRAIDVARRIMTRRNIELTATEEQLFRKIFDLTSDERRRQGMPM